MQDGKRRHEPLTGSCKIFAAKSGYLGAKNHIASAYRCAIHKGLSELTGLSLEWEWSGALGSVPEGPAQARRHALVPHRAHQIITFADLRVLSLDLGHDALVHLLLFLMVNS
jgi:hypothetical protein